MKLLELPPELFSQIVHELVLEVGVCEAFQYRLTCRSFARFLYKEIIFYQPDQSYYDHFLRWPREGLTWGQRPTLSELVKKFGATILAARLIAPYGFGGILVAWLTSVVQETSRFDDGVSTFTKEQCSANICNALGPCGVLYDYLTNKGLVIPKEYHGSVPAAAAAASGNVAALRKILLDNVKRGVPLRPLGASIVVAAVSGQADVLRELLLYAGSIIKPPASLLNGAMKAVIRQNHLECAELLFSYQQSTNLCIITMRSYQNDCFVTGSRQMLDIIQKEKRQPNFSLHLDELQKINALSKATPELFRLLLQDGLIKPNSALDIYCGHKTALGVALSNDRYDIARMLIEHGADVNMRPPSAPLGVTALWHASNDGDIDAVRFLLDHGAEIGYKTGDSCCPIEAATERGHTEILALLLDAKAARNSD
ncbi:ankyrin [Dothidotthia symphoricarpi CBS 119687]|uniref:Ankyrin n=1 Tax=Dothidotthia symphoricarpi CBS 119687 TaxID=1392245 RepID=A0A6A6A4E2_9PLEO|nr:ankyrin [Dothidotthia symphoricarpi CBS 119687]KAF2125628.1 ankyrin [Dothidotthia symphoricarpi CBS 119687]